MAAMNGSALLTWLRNFRPGQAGVPLVMIAILAMMVLPLPPVILDLLFSFNIALAMVVLLVAAQTRQPLEFAVFPTLLLVTTLMRLSLNVASTRAVLLHGHTGPDAAGKVIEAFASFLVGGNFAVGLVVFAILVVINFVVITKGAGRIAEVSARFALDAMPGKQMAIDADLNAGMIDQEEAKRRRLEVGQEADFYGSMDGASKFVRGDAIAGILILFVSMVGGLAIGILQHNLPIGQAANNYVLLSIGDGLVAQVPALMISTAAGMIVSRVGKEHDIGQQMSRQLLSTPHALAMTGGILALLGVIPGMPHFSFLALGAGFGYGAWALTRRREREAQAAAAASVPAAPASAADNGEATWSDIVPVDLLGLEVGYRLVPLVDKQQDGELLTRIKGIRKKFAQEVGFLPPPVHIRDNLELRPNGYRISLKGVTIGEGEAPMGMLLAINPGNAAEGLTGQATRDPAFGLPAIWIERSQREAAQLSGYTVVDVATVVATHLHSLMGKHAGALLGRQEAQALVDHFAKSAPKLIEDIVPKLVSLSVVHRVLQNLLEEGVHLRDFRTIVEAVAEAATRTQDPAEITAQVRVALGSAIVQGLYGAAEELQIIVVDPELEKVLHQALGQGGDSLVLEPSLADGLLRSARQVCERQETLGQPTAVLVPDRLRQPLARILRRVVPQARVLAHGEIPDTRTIRVSAILGAAA